MLTRVGLRPKASLVLSIMLLGLIGCSRFTSPPNESPLETPTVSESPLRTPTPRGIGTGLPTWNQEPDPDKAVVRGHIEKTGDQALLGEIFLAKAVPTSEPNVELLELDEEHAPKAKINRNTLAFVLTEVDPGRYGLIVWEPMSSSALRDPETGETLIIEVEGGKIIDLGTLYFP